MCSRQAFEGNSCRRFKATRILNNWFISGSSISICVWGSVAEKSGQAPCMKGFDRKSAVEFHRKPAVTFRKKVCGYIRTMQHFCAYVSESFWIKYKSPLQGVVFCLSSPTWSHWAARYRQGKLRTQSPVGPDWCMRSIGDDIKFRDHRSKSAWAGQYSAFSAVGRSIKEDQSLRFLNRIRAAASWCWCRIGNASNWLFPVGLTRCARSTETVEAALIRYHKTKTLNRPETFTSALAVPHWSHFPSSYH